MKKFLIMIVVMIVIGCTYSLAFSNIGGFKDADYTIFTKGDTGGNGIWLYGDTYMIACNKKELTKLVTLSNVIGYQATFEGDYNDMLKELDRQSVAVISNDSIEGVYIIYGISDKCGKSVTVGGKSVNVQVAIRGNKITVGTPLIMGSY